MKKGMQAGRATLLLGGDVCPIGRYEKKILAGEPVFDDSLLEAFRQSDFSIVNLEAPLCAAGLPCGNPGESGLKADPEIAAFLKRIGVTAAGLANNHIRDFGDEGVRQTAQALERNGVLHTGAGANLAEAQKPLAVTVNGLRLGIWALAERELNVATGTKAGSSWFRPEEDVHAIREMRPRFDFLLVYVHAGHEFMGTPSPRIRAAYRSLVEAGADAVIGHHPHVMQGAETWKNGLIAYSLGNLVFDSPYVSAQPDTDSGCLLRLEIAPRRIVEAEFIPYTLRDATRVTVLEGAGREAFMSRFRALSELLADDSRFDLEWEQNVKARWQSAYKHVVEAFSATIRDPAKISFPRRAKNLITCPTHVELLAKAFELMEEGKIPRG
jgi:poly-gamma-glutamate synthesis protein (capsule biosynthesis protein)